MGCNMCVVQKPEDQYRVMFQVKELSRLSRDPAQDLQDPLLASIRRRGVRKRAGLASRGGLVTMGVADCVDGCTQTDISFQNLLAPGNLHQTPPPSSPKPPHVLVSFPEPVYYDPNDYFDAAQHEVDRQDELEYEEVELYKSRQQDKLGLTVCYRTDEEEDLGIYVGEVNPHGIAAIDGRIRKGDRILQINGLDVEDREEAVAILTREDSTNISLLLARPETEGGSKRWKSDTQLDAEEPDLELLDSSHPLVRKSASGLGVGPGSVDRQHTETSRDSPDLLQTVLSNSQELDSGVGRTDESTRNEESSEHDLLGDDHTSASNTNATNTPGSMRRFFSASLLPSQELRFSTDSLLGLDCLGLDPRDQPEKPYARDAVRMAMPGLTEQECERYKELLEIKCYYERSSTLEGGQGSTVSLDVNRNEKLWPHELALLEEELRHLEKCRNVLRAQKMQQLRERCRKAWPLEDKSTGTGTGLDIHAAPGRPETCEHALSDINELPERERYEKDGTSAYNTGGGSCRSSALANQRFRPPSSQRDGAGAAGGGGGRANLNHTCSPPRNAAEVGSKVRSQSRDAGGRQGAEVRRHPKERSGGAGADSSPYLAHRPARTRPPRRYLSCTQLRSPSPARDGDPDPEGGASPMSLGSTYEDGGQASADLLLAFPAPVPPASPRMEWKVKIRSDGSRYVAKRPRDRLLKARAMKIREERSGTTTDDDAVSEMKMGRYWSKEERKQQLLRAREQRRRRELMVQSRLDLLRVQGGQQEAASILELWHRRSTKKRSRRILDNWITIQELLAHGSRSADGKKVYNPLLSVTTV
uniref:PDZ domain containing 4 n=1 Tax=Tetraodon nigroviridis TaxID=99883 RepID=H3D4N7_TETNG